MRFINLQYCNLIDQFKLVMVQVYNINYTNSSLVGQFVSSESEHKIIYIYIYIYIIIYIYIYQELRRAELPWKLPLHASGQPNKEYYMNITTIKLTCINQEHSSFGRPLTERYCNGARQLFDEHNGNKRFSSSSAQ